MRLDRLQKQKELTSLRQIINITQGEAVDDTGDELEVSEATVIHLKMKSKVFREALQTRQKDVHRLETQLTSVQQNYDRLQSEERRQSREILTLRERLRSITAQYGKTLSHRAVY